MLWFWLIFYTRNQAHRREQRGHGRAAVTEEGQRNADDRGDADAHADIDEGLERDSRAHAHTEQHVEGPAGVDAHPEAVDDNDYQQRDNDQAADHAPVFADAGKDKVRVLAGEGGGRVPLLHAGETA